MSCERGFTDNPTNQQQTANPRAVAPHNALRLLEDDLKAARDILMAKVDSVASESVDDIDELDRFIDAIIEESEEAAKAGFLVVERLTLEALRIAPSDPSREIAHASRDFDWLTRRAWRDFKQAVARETT